MEELTAPGHLAQNITFLPQVEYKKLVKSNPNVHIVNAMCRHNEHANMDDKYWHPIE
jgi:hypothetical protein